MSLVRINPEFLDDLENALASHLQRSGWTQLFEARLGALIDGVMTLYVDEDEREYNDEVYYRVDDLQEPGRAICKSGAIVAGQRVLIGKPPGDGRWHVWGAIGSGTTGGDTPGEPNPGVAIHASQHSYAEWPYTGQTGAYILRGGTDPVWVEARQLHNLGLRFTNMTVQVGWGWYRFGNRLQWYAGGTLDLTDYIPNRDGYGRWVVLALDRDGTLTAFPGSAFWIEFLPREHVTLLPTMNGNYYNIGAVQVRYGDTTVDYTRVWAGMVHNAVPDEALLRGFLHREIEPQLNQLQSDHVRYSTANVSNPPTDAELDALWGQPATVGAGFKAIIDDNGADANVYYVVSSGTSWWYASMTKAV
jgi:hypothetical protein